MKTTRALIRTTIALFVFGIGLTASAQPVTETSTFAVNLSIADNYPNGLADTRTLVSGITDITGLSVTLNILGGFNGDMYGYLKHGSGFTVLLNRVGRTSTSQFGYSDSGFSVTFSDLAANDIHNYQLTLNPNGAAITGMWQPDGRDIHPYQSLDSVIPTTTLGSFNGLDASGDWTLFLADVSAVGTPTLQNWGLQITGNTVPEPGTLTLLVLGAVGLVFAHKRRRA